MGEGLVASIRDELTEYYRSVALLQSQVFYNQFIHQFESDNSVSSFFKINTKFILLIQACEGDGGGGTLRRVCVWAQEPLHRLTWLANIAHAAHHKKGISFVLT